MNRTNLKNYAPQARRDFIQAMTDRAAYFGLTATKTEPVVEKGEVAVIAGREHPRAVAKKRMQLEDRIQRHGFEQTMEAMAYTWFNRLVAIRFMELHGYLDHGFRVLSHPEGKPTPQIIDEAEHVELPGLKRETVIDLKLAGNKESELYRLLLTAQCNALHTAMPFLFEKIDDETELLLPDNLLHSDSLIRKLVGEIDEEDWQEVEIIGWLYQFYISEKKDAVIGKVVASEDIPAATQLFTPNWIVKYLVQNTLGRQWLATYPQSALRQQMAYYIEPAEQTPKVQEQLKAITPTSLNPEELTLLDPACGSGHILVEAYDLFKAIYQERGYRAKDIPALILQKNLFGLEIDDRAAQLAAFALLMKARADDRRLFEDHVQPQVMALVETRDMDAAEIAAAISGQWGAGRREEPAPPPGHLFEKDDNLFTRALSRKALAAVVSVATKSSTSDDGPLTADIRQLIDLFAEARTFGSLIQVPPELAARLPLLEQRVHEAAAKGDLSRLVAIKFQPVVEQARLLARQYDAVVTNPPYMGAKAQTPILKAFANQFFPNAKADVFAMFIERGFSFAKTGGDVGYMTPFVWFFIKSYESLRTTIVRSKSISTLIHPEYNTFWESAHVTICAFVIRNVFTQATGAFIDLRNVYGADAQQPVLREAAANPNCKWRYTVSSTTFEQIPGFPIAYWATERVRLAFKEMPPFSDFAETRIGLITGDNARFLRRWWEVSIDHIGFGLTHKEAAPSTHRWFPIVKGGEFRKWYGNLSEVVDWKNDGRELQSVLHPSGARTLAHNFNLDKLFQQGLNWSKITSSSFSARIQPMGCIFTDPSASAFPKHDDCKSLLLAFLASKVPDYLLRAINPTLNYQPGNIDILPVSIGAMQCNHAMIEQITANALSYAKEDWDSCETSWDFQTLPVLRDQGADAPLSAGRTLAQSQAAADAECLARFQRRKQLEEENNRLFIDAYGLQDELSPEVSDDQITLYRPDRAQDIQRLISYALGCLMGRYSLNQPGLMYAHSGNVGFDPSQYRTFPADPDGIVPLTETDWFPDDAAHRFIELLSVAWPKEQLEENFKFVAESLCPNKGESPRETLRRYLATGFYKHHLQVYKRRPIYWLFSSGKQRAFQCLVYLHRYHEGTLARMRTEYVIPLQSKLAARIDQLEVDKTKATSTSHRNKLQKEQTDLKKQQTELLTFEEKLKHAADQKISLDLDDGVKVNYAKFGDLLAEAKAITGGKEEE